MTRRLVIGGTFNPVHRGHVAMAEGAQDALGIGTVDWVPCHTPHHRADDDLLPFELRCDLIRAATGGSSGMTVNAIEADLPKPSLTWRTIAALAEAEPEARLHFALGPREFLRLHRWVNGRKIAEAAHMVIVPRGPLERVAFEHELLAAWPGAQRVDPPPGAAAAWDILSGRHALLLDLPPVEISATMVRDRWRAGGDIADLVPEPVYRHMLAERAVIDRVWSGTRGERGT
ncbi:MAG: nicotinate-nicotinamide nucleotide adenylyltransferase [Minwuia sp.]|uniref:nicotinate-nicotinamide nucleotide adenylyltransferase n=1 Tax=Minwuia sp. TaxID=2493630 RepID=UPI003A8969AC